MSQTPPQELQDSGHAEREHFFGSAKVVAGLTLLSRVLGMFRDMTILWLGANWQTESFQFAFQLPNLFRRLFGEGALSAAFVPVFTLVDQEGRLFKPLAYSKNLAMAIAALLAITLDPAMRMLFARVDPFTFRPRWLAGLFTRVAVGKYYSEEIRKLGI